MFKMVSSKVLYLNNNKENHRVRAMNEQPIQKKVVSRNTAIALGIICVILAVVVVGTFTAYSILNSQIEDKEYQISSLNSQIADKDSQIADKNNTIISLNSQIQNLTSQKNQLQDVVDLAESTTWISSQTVNQTVNSTIYWNFSASYAGYVAVIVESSTSTNTYVRLIYSSHDVNYDNQISVGTNGTAVFPVLPTSIEIRVGTNPSVVTTITLTITYYY